MPTHELARLALFDGLCQAQLDVLLPLFEPCQYPAQAQVFDQGDPAHFLYIVVEGEIAIRYKPYDGEPIVLTRIPPGGVFGWSSALRRQRYTSAAIAEQNCRLYRISAAELHRVCDTCTEMRQAFFDRLARSVAERLEGKEQQVISILNFRPEQNP